MRARQFCVVAALGLFGLAGCGPPKLDEKRTIELDGGTEIKSIDLPSIKKPQKVTVEFTADAEVAVAIFKESDVPEGNLFAASKDKALAITDKPAKSGSISAEVPENTATRVLFASKEKAKVDAHVTNRK